MDLVYTANIVKCVLMAQEQSLVIFSLMFAGFGLSHTNYMDYHDERYQDCAHLTCKLLLEFGYQSPLQCVTMVLHEMVNDVKNMQTTSTDL